MQVVGALFSECFGTGVRVRRRGSVLVEWLFPRYVLDGIVN